MKRLTIWRCPDCGEQISDEQHYDEARNEYVRGHYHDPPEGWHTEDGPPKEDPWFDAEEVPVLPASEVESLEEKRADKDLAFSLLTAELRSVTKHRDDLVEALQAAPYPSDLSIAEGDRDEFQAQIESLRAEIQELEAVAVRRYTELNEAQRALKQAQETLSSPEKKNSTTTNSETLEGEGER